MIELLRIEQLALVDRIELEFGPGLNVVTGETGAGKSVVLGALGMLAGSGQFASDRFAQYAAVGELALEGTMRPVKGVLSMAMAAARQRDLRGIVLPRENAPEAAVVEEIEAGATLSEAMAKCPKVFNRLYINMIKAGEAGGALEVILQISQKAILLLLRLFL